MSTFDEQAAVYDQWYATPLGQLVDRVEKEALFALLPGLPGRLVLDVGCGTGNISLALASHGAQVVGVDSSAPMLTAARKKAARLGWDITWIRASARQLPFGKESFDGVVCVLALDFISDRAGVLQEMVRVLRRGGFLAVAVLNRYSLWTLKRVIRAWFRPSLWREVRSPGTTAPASSPVGLGGYPGPPSRLFSALEKSLPATDLSLAGESGKAAPSSYRCLPGGFGPKTAPLSPGPRSLEETKCTLFFHFMVHLVPRRVATGPPCPRN
ncbi:MAG: class I SAM-dependent methyltransferase [Deltaproteobacteria bacterium]|nr:class I SAM-dependent methyltransferase [Deltaproteobacteria bacterium]